MAEDAEAAMEAVEAAVVMAAAEEAAADSEDNEAVAEDSVVAAAVPLAVVEADQCAAAAWVEAAVDHSLTENSCSFRIVSQMALHYLLFT